MIPTLINTRSFGVNDLSLPLLLTRLYLRLWMWSLDGCEDGYADPQHDSDWENGRTATEATPRMTLAPILETK